MHPNKCIHKILKARLLYLYSVTKRQNSPDMYFVDLASNRRQNLSERIAHFYNLEVEDNPDRFNYFQFALAPQFESLITKELNDNNYVAIQNSKICSVNVVIEESFRQTCDELCKSIYANEIKYQYFLRLFFEKLLLTNRWEILMLEKKRRSKRSSFYSL